MERMVSQGEEFLEISRDMNAQGKRELEILTGISSALLEFMKDTKQKPSNSTPRKKRKRSVVVNEHSSDDSDVY